MPKDSLRNASEHTIEQAIEDAIVAEIEDAN